jgi:WD40 repeat protein
VGADHVVAQEFNHGFCGLIDELCVFGRDLTEDELGQLAGRLPRQRKDDPRPSGPPEVAPRWTFATGIPFGHDGALAASPDGRLLVAAATQRPARFYDLTEGKPRTDLPAFPAKAPLAFSPDGKYLAGRVFGVPRQVQVLNLPDKTLVPWQGPTEGGGVDIPEGLSFTADGKRIGIAARAPLLLEAADGAALPLTLPQGPVSFLHFGLDGKTVLVAGAGGYRPPRFRCDQVELATGKVVRWFGVDVGGGRDEPPELKATPDLGYLAVRQRDQTTIHVWQLAEEKKLAFPESLPGFAWRAFTWAPDHRTLVLSSTRGDLVLWDVFAEKETGRIRVQTEGAGAGAVACSGDGRWIAAGLRSGEVKVWAVADLRGKPFEPLRLPGPPAGR